MEKEKKEAERKDNDSIMNVRDEREEMIQERLLEIKNSPAVMDYELIKDILPTLR